MAKKEYDKALFRLISILRMLSCNQKPTVSELATEFNVTIRTIQKDIYQRLSDFHITKDANGKLIFMGDFSLC